MGHCGRCGAAWDDEAPCKCVLEAKKVPLGNLGRFALLVGRLGYKPEEAGEIVREMVEHENST